jgi:hypothetical protein
MPEIIKDRVCAQSSTNTHLPAWQAFNRDLGSNGDVGIWHETYVNMPRYGLGLVGSVFPAKGSRATAAKRLRGRNRAE